jgi:hypothetical protein
VPDLHFAILGSSDQEIAILASDLVSDQLPFIFLVSLDVHSIHSLDAGWVGFECDLSDGLFLPVPDVNELQNISVAQVKVLHIAEESGVTISLLALY